MNTEHISTGQAAQIIGLSYQKTQRAIFENKLDAEMVNGRWRISRESAERLRRELEQEAAR